MGFKTFTCVICGKEGLTKRSSYAVGVGRACREHQEAQDANNKRQEACRKAQEKRDDIVAELRKMNRRNFLPCDIEQYDFRCLEYLESAASDNTTNGFMTEILPLLRQLAKSPYAFYPRHYTQMALDDIEKMLDEDNCQMHFVKAVVKNAKDALRRDSLRQLNSNLVAQVEKCLLDWCRATVAVLKAPVEKRTPIMLEAVLKTLRQVRETEKQFSQLDYRLWAFTDDTSVYPAHVEKLHCLRYAIVSMGGRQEKLPELLRMVMTLRK